jgi:DNA-binding XRE family transcriptional regulator
MSTNLRIRLEGIADRLRQVREALGLTQERMAESCAVSRPTQSHLENGKAHPDLQYIALVDQQGGDWMYLLTGERGRSAAMVQADAELLRRVLLWADEFCCDENGQPLPSALKQRFVVDAFVTLREQRSRAKDGGALPQVLASILAESA